MENSIKKIKICFVIDRLNFGGAERLTIQLLNFLDKDKFEKTLIYLNEPSKELSFRDLINPEIKIKFLDISILKFRERIKQLKKLLSEFDIVHSCLESANLYCSIVNFIYPTGTKFISTIHGIDMPFVKDSYLKDLYENSGYKNKFLYNYLQTFLFKFYFQFIAVCNDIRSYLINQRKIDPEKIKVFYHGIDLTVNKKSPKNNVEYKKKFQINEKDYVIGYVGRLAHGKGLEYLIKEFNNILKFIPEAKLMFVGDGEMSDYLVKYAKENFINNKVIFTGYQKNVSDFYALMDVFVIPSFSESTNLTVLESLNSGAVVVSSDAGGLKEIIEDGKNGLLFKTGDFNEMNEKIFFVYKNRDTLDTYRVNALVTLKEKFDLNKNLEEIQNYILSISKN